jgi:hypothetical protein
MMSSYYVVQGEPLHKVLGFPTKDPIRSDPDYIPPQGHYPERMTMLSYQEATAKDLHYDVIVIGSGAGGGVVAGQLAMAGKRVLVIEKGRYFHESEFDSCESKGFEHLYEKSSLFPSTDGSLSIMAGSTFGGSTTINWSASLKVETSKWKIVWDKHSHSVFFSSFSCGSSVLTLCSLNILFEKIGQSKVSPTIRLPR